MDSSKIDWLTSTRCRSQFPFFRRWIKVAAVDEPLFTASLEAKEILYNFLAMRATDVLAPPPFRVGGVECFRPSAAMLTSLDISPDATAVEMPPLYDEAPFEAVLRASHGKYVFSADNEVLFFSDELMDNGYGVAVECPGFVVLTLAQGRWPP